MNLTKCLLASLCVAAMTASAGVGVIKSDSFEAGLGAGWEGTPAEAVVPGSTDVTDADTPMVGVGDTALLKLETNGGTWTNTVGASFTSAPIYVDMLAKFVPSEELPAVDGLVKIAMAMTNGLLAVTKDDGLGANMWVVTSTAIDTSLWYRVTVMLKFTSPVVQATVKINGTEVTVDGNTLFDITDNDGNQNLNGIGFSGTGFIDEVVVTDADPFGGGSSTVAFGGTGSQVSKAELDAWKLLYGISGTEDPLSFDAFVMNVAPETDGTSPDLFVASIAVDGNVTVTVMAKYADGTLVALGNPLNNGGAILVQGKVELSDPDWAPLGAPLTFDPGANKFFMVVITNGLVL